MAWLCYSDEIFPAFIMAKKESTEPMAIDSVDSKQGYRFRSLRPGLCSFGSSTHCALLLDCNQSIHLYSVVLKLPIESSKPSNIPPSTPIGNVTGSVWYPHRDGSGVTFGGVLHSTNVCLTQPAPLNSNTTINNIR